jgi:hypothetical protein
MDVYVKTSQAVNPDSQFIGTQRLVVDGIVRVVSMVICRL